MALGGGWDDGDELENAASTASEAQQAQRETMP